MHERNDNIKLFPLRRLSVMHTAEQWRTEMLSRNPVKTRSLQIYLRAGGRFYGTEGETGALQGNFQSSSSFIYGGGGGFYRATFRGSVILYQRSLNFIGGGRILWKLLCRISIKCKLCSNFPLFDQSCVLFSVHLSIKLNTQEWKHQKIKICECVIFACKYVPNFVFFCAELIRVQ